jgi:ABC-type nitrate/sulfonate/bicarbonate transport system permease component
MAGAVVGEYLGSTRGLGDVISPADAAISRLEQWLRKWKH